MEISQIMNLLVLVVGLLFLPCLESVKHKLLVILVDGFRPGYLDFGDFPGLRHFTDQGVWTSMEPVFPTNTYPNMYTLVTGLYAESHGMLDNIMVNEEKREWFLMHPHANASHEHWWQQAEPVWISATKADLNCAVFWWFGCEVVIRDVQPMMCVHPKSIYSWPNFYDEVNLAFEKVVDMFSKDEADVVLLYYEDLDYRGHKYGPESNEMKTALNKLDSVLTNLWDRIDETGLKSEVNVILISDHGMVNTGESSIKYVDLSAAVKAEDVKIMFGLGSSAGILPKADKIDKVYADLQGIEGLHVYKKNDIPDSYHVKKGSLLSPIVVIADPGYFIKKLSNEAIKEVFESVPDENYWQGFHGYDSVYMPEMNAVFYAVGPDFRQNYHSEPIKSVDVYNLICHLIDLTPRPNNGTWSNVKPMLIVHQQSRSFSEL